MDVESLKTHPSAPSRKRESRKPHFPSAFLPEFNFRVRTVIETDRQDGVAATMAPKSRGSGESFCPKVSAE
jgi:hypothetical protein